MKYKKISLYLNIFLLVLPLFFFFLYFVPFGHIIYKKDFSKNYNNIFLGKGPVYKFGPNDRIIDKNKLIAEPAYFYLKTARNFDLAKMKIKYKISDKAFSDNNFINVEAGVLLNKNNWNYKLYPVYNKTLNDLSHSWNYQKIGKAIFFQKEKKFDTLTNFLENKDFSSLLLYNYNLENDFVLNNYERSDYEFKTPALRGSHVFYTYLKNEDLQFDFSFRNLDIENKSQLDLFVYLGQDVVYSKSFSADEFVDGKKIDFNLNLPDLPESVYKIEIRASDSFIVEKIVSHLSKFVFLHKLNLYDTKNGFQVFSNKNDFRIKSLEAQCLNSVNINDQPFIVDRIFQQFSFNVPNKNLNIISSESCGMLIEGRGLFSFSEQSFFNPLIDLLDKDNLPDNYNFVIAEYDFPQKEDNYYSSEVEIDLKNAWRENGEYRFIISAPFLKGLDNEEYLEIKNIEIELFGKNFKDKLSEYFQN